MRTDLEYLPDYIKSELALAVQLIHDGFQAELNRRTGVKARAGKILRIILYGSFARDTWVDEPTYQSDLDLLVVVNTRLHTNFEFWQEAKNAFFHNKAIRRQISVLPETLSEINSQLGDGNTFYSDILEDGILLYERQEARRFATYKPLTPGRALKVAERHYQHWFPSAVDFYEGHKFYLKRKTLNLAAFSLHQATENAYKACVTVLKNHNPDTHDIERLHNLCKELTPSLKDVWPTDRRWKTANFQRLKDAYVKARYSPHYEIRKEDLDWLGERVAHLLALTEQICKRQIESLRKAL